MELSRRVVPRVCSRLLAGRSTAKQEQSAVIVPWQAGLLNVKAAGAGCKRRLLVNYCNSGHCRLCANEYGPDERQLFSLFAVEQCTTVVEVVVCKSPHQLSVVRVARRPNALRPSANARVSLSRCVYLDQRSRHLVGA